MDFVYGAVGRGEKYAVLRQVYKLIKVVGSKNLIGVGGGELIGMGKGRREENFEMEFQNLDYRILNYKVLNFKIQNFKFWVRYQDPRFSKK